MSEDTNNNNNREQQLEVQLKRALADYDNLKKRLEKEKSDMVKFSNEMLLMQIVSVMDGLELTMQGFKKLLEKNGFVKEEVKVGEQFDPNRMEAVDSTEQGENVSEVYAHAYKLHDKIVRPAQVKLGKINPENQE